ncbi:MAG: glycosyltransferase [Vicinamibacteria bacterium]|nr:glycosyltransferase [Vicinamibacteria bacterium]
MRKLLRLTSSSPGIAAPTRSADEIVSRIRCCRGCVIFPPSIGWNANLFQRPHQLARAFARRGWISVFDSSKADDGVRGFQEIERNLLLFNGHPEILHRFHAPLLWTFTYNFDQSDLYPFSATILYDWIDDLAVFTSYERSLLERHHERAMSNADMVATVARSLHERALSVRADALYLPNAADVDHFASMRSPTLKDRDMDRIRAGDKPIAGYYGALAEWFDYELLDRAARLRPDWNFLLIGPEYDRSLRLSSIRKRPNVFWIGPRRYAELPAYLQLFDVALIPFKLNEITAATSPLKLYEYFAGGKPVVTTSIPECIVHPEVNVVSSANELASALDAARAQGRDPEICRRFRDVALANSWAERVRQVEGAITSRRIRPDNATLRCTLGDRSVAE